MQEGIGPRCRHRPIHLRLVAGNGCAPPVRACQGL